MKLEDIVCNLELSEKLRDLDVKQESLFYWHWYKKNRDYERIECYLHDEPMEDFDDGKWKGICYSAYTASELLESFPSKIRIDRQWYYYGTGKTDNNDEYYKKHEVSYSCGDFCHHLDRDDNICNALAKMLIFLIENKIIEVPI